MGGGTWWTGGVSVTTCADVVVVFFPCPTVYHNIESKFKRTTLRMKKQNEGASEFLSRRSAFRAFILICQPVCCIPLAGR